MSHLESGEGEYYQRYQYSAHFNPFHHQQTFGRNQDVGLSWSEEDDLETDSNSLDIRSSKPQQRSSGHGYTWRSPNGQLVSPALSNEVQPQTSRVMVSADDQLGLMIRGGAEFGLGIFVTGVLNNSVAFKLGLKPGDQLMSVNGSSFQNITHTAAVNLLSNSHRNSQLMVTFKRVGRIPYSPDRVPCNGDLSRVSPLSDNLQEVNMVTEKAQALLDPSHVSLLMFHLEQYRNKRINVESLVTSLRNIFDTQAKEGLFTEIDQLIFNEDLARYNKLVFENGQLFERFISTMNHYHNPVSGATRDSLQQQPRYPRANPRFVNSLHSSQMPQAKINPLAGPRTIAPRLMTTKLSGSLINTTDIKRVEIEKNNPVLGMVIEGGRDTSQKEPRIVNIQPGGQAFETAGLRVGQIIKQVDGKLLAGLHHKEIAKLLWVQYTRTDTPTMTLMVLDYKPSPQQLRRSVMLPQ